MSRIKIILLVAFGALLGALLVPTAATGAAAIIKVVVTNTNDNPVPVRGSVNVSGPQVGGDPVPVTGSVDVEDNRQPFKERLDLTWPNGSFIADVEHFQVPAGKRLVVEFAAASATVPDGQLVLVSVNAGNGAIGYPIPLDRQGVGNGNAFYRGSAPALDFIGPEGFIFPSAERQNPAGGAVPGTASGWVFLSGYLIDAN